MSFYENFKNAIAHLQALTQKETEYLNSFNINKVKEMSPEKEQAYLQVNGLFQHLEEDKNLAKSLNPAERETLLSQLDQVLALNQKNAESIGIHLEAKKSLIQSFKKSLVSKNFVVAGYTPFGKRQEINRRVSSPAISVSLSQQL